MDQSYLWLTVQRAFHAIRTHWHIPCAQRGSRCVRCIYYLRGMAFAPVTLTSQSLFGDPWFILTYIHEPASVSTWQQWWYPALVDFSLSSDSHEETFLRLDHLLGQLRWEEYIHSWYSILIVHFWTFLRECLGVCYFSVTGIQLVKNSICHNCFMYQSIKGLRYHRPLS